MGGEILDTDRRGYVSIQILRGIAATLVVLYHILGASRLIVASDNHPLAAGVDIFFVISGFVMVVSTEGRSMSGGAFLRARLQRIVPLYWIALIMAFALIAARVIDRPLPLPSEVLRSFLFVFYRDHFNGQPNPYLSVGWTLNYEMLFYLLFALTIRFSRFGQIAVIGAAFLALIALRRVVGDDGGLGLRLTSPLPLEFVAGMILAAFRDKLAALSPWCALPLVLIGIALLALNLSTARTVAYGIPAVMLVAGGVIAETQARRRTLRPAAIIGDTSYALYLFHSLVVASLLPLLVGFPPIFSLPVLAVLCIAVALAIHYTVENRIDLAFKRAKRPAEGTITA